MRYTTKQLESDIAGFNASLRERKSDFRLIVGCRNNYTALDLATVEQAARHCCQRNLECGTPRECLAAGRLFLASVPPIKETLSQLEFHNGDMEQAESIAKHLGYEQTAYTSTIALIGLFCLPENPAHPENRNKPHRGGCVIKTKELGFLFVQTAEELGLEDL